jgi:hypothetical protein
MSLFSSLLPYWNRPRLLSLVDRLVARAQSDVWHRVRDRALGMGIYEARGYIRARAARVIERELALAVVSIPPLRPGDRQIVVQAVSQRVVRRLLLENLRRQEPARARRRLAA